MIKIFKFRMYSEGYDADKTVTTDEMARQINEFLKDKKVVSVTVNQIEFTADGMVGIIDLIYTVVYEV